MVRGRKKIYKNLPCEVKAGSLGYVISQYDSNVIAFKANGKIIVTNIDFLYSDLSAEAKLVLFAMLINSKNLSCDDIEGIRKAFGYAPHKMEQIITELITAEKIQTKIIEHRIIKICN